jgi:hypothetical protein
MCWFYLFTLMVIIFNENFWLLILKKREIVLIFFNDKLNKDDFVKKSLIWVECYK